MHLRFVEFQHTFPSGYISFLLFWKRFLLSHIFYSHFCTNLLHYNNPLVSVNLGTFIKLRNVTIIFVMSLCPLIRPRETAGLPLEGFS